MAKILRARTAGKQPVRIMTGQKVSGSFHDPAELTRRTRSKISVRRLFVKDPYNKNSTATVARFGSAVDHLTDNANPKFDPSQHPGAVSVKKVPQKPFGADKGHQKVFKPNRQTLFGGKTIKKRK